MNKSWAWPTSKTHAVVLGWTDLRALGKSDHTGRWYPNADIAEYFRAIRSPSRAFPHSYARAAMTRKFALWLNQRTGA